MSTQHLSIKHRKLMTLMSQAGINDADERHAYILAWTRGRTESSKELTSDELNDLIWKLQSDFTFTNNRNAVKELALREKRSTILAIAQRVGIHEGTTFTKFNRWMKTHSILKKKLTEYNIEELDKLASQLHKLEANQKKSAETPGTKAWYHKNKMPGITGN